MNTRARRLSREQAGHSMWWGLFMLPYPVGWVLGLIGAARSLAAAFKRPDEA